jgi:hypothetical protein
MMPRTTEDAELNTADVKTAHYTECPISTSTQSV